RVAGAGRPAHRVAARRHFGEERVVALAEETAVGAGPADGLTPAEVARHVDVIGQVALRGAEVFADAAHARRVGLAGADDVAQERFVAGVAGQRVVAAGAVVEAADDGDLVRP